MTRQVEDPKDDVDALESAAVELLLAATALAGRVAKTNVSTTGNVPAAYSHVYMSVQEVWLNTSATAGPDDTKWVKFPLETPATVDLETATDGTLTSMANGLSVPIGTYAQVRLIPVDSGPTLLDSAQALGALYNSEVDYTDSAGTLHRVPLELLNPDKGIGDSRVNPVKSSTPNVFATSSSTSNSTKRRTARPRHNGHLDDPIDHHDLIKLRDHHRRDFAGDRGRWLQRPGSLHLRRRERNAPEFARIGYDDQRRAGSRGRWTSRIRLELPARARARS